MFNVSNLQSSMTVFREFLVQTIDPETNETMIDASAITSLQCYQEWLDSRKSFAKKPENSFQRALSAHLTGADGRDPFTSIEEKAILQHLRSRRRWKCFENSNIKFGFMGFRKFI